MDMDNSGNSNGNSQRADSNRQRPEHSSHRPEHSSHRPEQEIDEIATGLMNVMLQRLHQQGRGYFVPADYKGLRLMLQAMMGLGQQAKEIESQSLEALRAATEQKVTVVNSVLTEQELKALLDASRGAIAEGAIAEGLGI